MQLWHEDGKRKMRDYCEREGLRHVRGQYFARDSALPVRLLLVLLFPLCAHAQMYKCVDERGRIQYTDKPQAGCKETAIKPSPPISGQVTAPPKEDFAREDADLKRRLMENEASAAKERQERMALVARCARLRDDLASFQNASRIITRNAGGEREYMDDATREQRVARIQQELRACP